MNRARRTATILCLLLAVMTAGAAQAVIVDLDATVHCAHPYPLNGIVLDQGWYSATLMQGTYTAWKWRPQSDSWGTRFKVMTFDGANYVEYAAGNYVNATTAQAAFDQTTVYSVDFYQPVNGDVYLRVADNACGDNAGGVTLEILPILVSVEDSSWGVIKELYR